MDPVPLIPKSNQVQIHDTSHIIREVFQDIISAPECSKKIAENVEKYHSESETLKAIATRVIADYDGSELCMKDIGLVEDNIMVNQGEYMKEQDFIEKDEVLTEWLKLKRKAVFLNIDLDKTKKYGLLQKLDLLPTKPERSMDFRINSNRHRCPSPCPSRLDIPPMKFEKTECKRLKHNKRFDLLAHSARLDIIPTKLEKNERKRKYPINVPEKPQRPVIFKADPECVIFKDYEIGVSYVKKFKLRNVSKVTQAFIPRILPTTSFFKVELESGSTRVAPGVCVVFSVKYQTDIYKDVEEVMIFNTYRGQDVEVKLRSSRQPPNLIAFVFKSLQHFTEKFVTIESLNFNDRSRAIALNSTIDCGSCLLGNKISFNLILKNEGTIGQFFIVSEDDWYYADISDANKGMELMSQAFHIHPTYFEIDTDEFVELDLTFFPLNFGLEVEKLFLLCNNNTLEELEIVGDGVLFEPNSIVIKAEYKNENMIDMDAKSTYFLNFGKCIPHQKQTRRFGVLNNSIVDLNYKWEVRESVCHINGTKLKKMDPNWIKLHHIMDFLPAQSTSEFQLELKTSETTTGLYSLVFTLYVLDIPEASLVENKTFYAVDELQTPTIDRSEEKVLNIAIGEIEMKCEVVPIHLQLDPENVTIPYRMGYQDVFKQKVQLYTSGLTHLDCFWIEPITDCIEVCPLKFTINPGSIFICDIIIHAYTYHDIEEKLTLMVNNGLHKKQCNVSAKVVKPIARFSETVLNFGYLPKGKPANGKKLHIENIGRERIYWEIFEFYFDHECNAICELDASKHLSLTCGELKKNDSCEVTYTIDNCFKHHRWLSFLILLSSHPTLEAMDSLCLITYEITQPEIVIHSRSSQQPILYIGRLLYIGISTLHTICLHNIGTKLPGSFIWGKPVGKQADALQITCTPRSGIIQPQKCTHITILLIPNETGVFDEVYVPCFVGDTDEPIMLSILYIASNISLYFYLPDEEGRLKRIFWPPSIVSDFEGLSLELDRFQPEEEEKISKHEVELYKQLNSLRSGCGSSSEHGSSLREAVSGVREEMVEHIAFQSRNETNYELHLSLQSSESSITEKLDSPYISTPSSAPLQDYSGSDLVLHDHLMECHNVPLRTPIKKTIVIENLTPIAGNFATSITNFYELEQEDNDRDVMEDILVKLKIKKRNEWEENINSDYGIMVKATPVKGSVESHKSIEIDLWVYANTWGTYIEEVIIEINEILPFCFNLAIQVVGIPLEYPITLNSISNTPILRFGSISYLSKPIKRSLKITNFGAVPVCLEWCVFITNDTLLYKEIDSFDEVAGDFYPPANNIKTEEEIEITLKSTIAQEYGIEDNSIFQIEPREIIISPKSTQSLAITICTAGFRPKFTKTEIEANLLGFIRLNDEFIFQTNLYSRPTYMNLPPTKVKLLATLELPLLKLELIKGDTRIKVYANDVIAAQEVKYERVLVFKNVDSAPATVYMHCTSPFRVVSLKTAQKNSDINAVAAVVQPGDCVEVLVECFIDAEEVLQYSDMLFNEKTTVFTEIPDFKNCAITVLRYLNIHQHGLKKQITALELVIFYPELKVSHALIDFGVVFVGNTKKMLLTLTNLTGSQLPFTIHKPTTSSVITITPSNGIIPKANGTTPTSIILSLYFIPRECNLYQETIRILTNIPFHSFSVNLVGAGSNNEKFYVEGV